MPARDRSRPLKALGLLAHAYVETKPRTAEEAVACNVRTAAIRDWILYAPARPVLGPAMAMSAAEVEEHRAEAVRHLRSTCAACGLCGRFDIKPP